MTNQKNLRERNKEQKLGRIREAARQLFREKGFEATTTREVAELAEVGTGTLFLYIKDKQELLLLVFLDAFDELIEEALANAPENTGLLEQLLQIFSRFFHYYGQDMETTRIYLKELTFQKVREGLRLRAARQVEYFVGRLVELIEKAKARGEVRPEVDSLQAGQNFFALYFSVLTLWLTGTVSSEIAVNQLLRNAFELQIKGLI
jgi:AcrR family transcriptional regulator